MDISSSSVKLVELADAGRGNPRVERYAIEALPKDAVLDGNITNLDAVVDSVQRGWKRMATRTKNVALALPTAAVITKKIIVPAGLSDEELEVQVETEANQYIPFALEEVNLDFQVVGPSPSGPEEVEVLIAASRKEKVEDRVAVAEASGLKAIVMDVESYAIQSSFELIQQQDHPVGIQHQGALELLLGYRRVVTQVGKQEERLQLHPERLLCRAPVHRFGDLRDEAYQPILALALLAHLYRLQVYHLAVILPILRKIYAIRIVMLLL